MIKFSCAHCGKNVSAPDRFAGKRGKCPGCQKPVQIPAADADVETGFEVVEESGFEVVDEEAVTAKPAARTPVKASAKAAGIRSKPVDDDIPMAEAVDDEDEEDDRPRRRRRRVEEVDDDDEYDDDRPRRRRSRRGPRMGRSGYYSCPDCGADAAERVTFTWWGGFIGPMLFSHVSCRNCGTTYNGRSGKSNTTAIILYLTIPTVIGLMLAVIGGILGAFQ